MSTRIENEGAVVAVQGITETLRALVDSVPGDISVKEIDDESVVGMDVLAVCCHVIEASPIQFLEEAGLKGGVLGLRGQTNFGGRMLADDPSAFTLDKYMSDLRVTFDRFTNAPVPVFAYSHTGYFAVNYALQDPDRISALVLVEPALYTDEAELRQRAELARSGAGADALASMIRYAGGTPDLGADERAYAERLSQDWQEQAFMAYEWTLRADNPISDEQLASLRMPVLLIGGTASGAAFMVERAARAIPHAAVWWVHGADHFSLVDPKNAEEIAGVMQAFLKSVGATD